MQGVIRKTQVQFLWERSWRRNGNPLQYSYLGHPMNWGAWWATTQSAVNDWHDWATKHARTQGKWNNLASCTEFAWWTSIVASSSDGGRGEIWEIIYLYWQVLSIALLQRQHPKTTGVGNGFGAGGKCVSDPERCGRRSPDTAPCPRTHFLLAVAGQVLRG